MHIKFCGFTQAEDIKTAVKLGVDAIGLVFYPPSPRAVTSEQAKQLIRHIPAFTTVVALVVNINEEELTNLANTVPFDVIQFHGDESADICAKLAKQVNKRWIKALRINSEPDNTTQDTRSIAEHIAEYINNGASGILLDAYHKAKYGGTGERFDWSLIPTTDDIAKFIDLAEVTMSETVSSTKVTKMTGTAGIATPIILAGGLNADNIAHTTNLPITAVDVSGGIEFSKGIKDPIKMHDFIQAVQRL